MPLSAANRRLWAATIRRQVPSQSAFRVSATRLNLDECRSPAGRAQSAGAGRGTSSLSRVESELPEQASELTAEQQQVVAHRDGPLLVLGAAGSGRSEALAARAAAL